MTPSVLNIIVAAGSGTRFGADRPKQFLPLEGKPVVRHAIDSIRAALPQNIIVVVLSPQWMDFDLGPDVIKVPGGATRWESVRNAIEATAHMPADIITVHDGARPLPSPSLIRSAVEACAGHQGAIPAIPLVDSIRRTDGSPASRADFRAVQTPQAFRAPLLRRAYQLPYSDLFTDDASVMSAAGFTDIVLTEGTPANLKITHPMDLEIARLWMQRK